MTETLYRTFDVYGIYREYRTCSDGWRIVGLYYGSCSTFLLDEKENNEDNDGNDDDSTNNSYSDDPAVHATTVLVESIPAAAVLAIETTNVYVIAVAFSAHVIWNFIK